MIANTVNGGSYLVTILHNEYGMPCQALGNMDEISLDGVSECIKQWRIPIQCVDKMALTQKLINQDQEVGPTGNNSSRKWQHSYWLPR